MRKKLSKKSCWWLDDHSGISCNGYRKKETALKAMQELWDDDPEYNTETYGEMVVDFTLDNVKEEKAVCCGDCSYYTIDGEGECGECGKRIYYEVKTFTIYF